MNKYVNKKNIVSSLFIAVVVLYGINSIFCARWLYSDEAYYAMEGYVFAKGDIPFVENWCPFQLMGLYSAPVIWLYLKIMSSKGLLLFLRFFYWFLKGSVSIWAFLYLKKRDRVSFFSILSVFLFFVAVPLRLATISYNTVSLIPIFIAYVLYVYGEDSCWNYVVIGAMYALAVLGQPLYVIFYFVLLFLCVGSLFTKNKGKTNLKIFIYISSGAAIVALPLIAYILLRSSLMDFIYGLRMSLSNDGHTVGASSLVGKLIKDLHFFILEIPLVTIVNIGCIVFLAIGKKYKNKLLSMNVVMLGMIISMAYSLRLYPAHQIMNIIFVWGSIELLFFVPQIMKKKCSIMIVAALLYVVAVSMGTMTQFYTTSTSMFIFAYVFAFEIGYVQKDYCNHFVKSSCIFVIMVIFGLQMYFLGDEPYRNLDKLKQLKSGPYAGLYTTEDVYDEVQTKITKMQNFNIDTKEVLYLDAGGHQTTWQYMYYNVDIGTFDGGLQIGENEDAKNVKYYELNPQKRPTIFLVINGDKEFFVNSKSYEYLDEYKDEEDSNMIKYKYMY